MKTNDTKTLIPADAILDLHLHTIYSDGLWTPTDLFNHLAFRSFRVVSIVDHDTTAHVAELQRLGQACGILVLAGVEVTSEWNGMVAHVLCYAGEFSGSGLAELVDGTCRKQLENTRAVYAELENRGYRFPRRSEVLSDQDGELRRPVDNARLLVGHGYAEDLEEGLVLIRDAGYVIIAAPIHHTVEAAHSSGAVALLAHPGRGGGEIVRYDPPLLEEMLESTPLDGLEVFYPTHTQEQASVYLALANGRTLLVGAGSDSHDAGQRLPIAYRAEQCERLLGRCGIHVTF
jgi:3',5'-nucleoside bisphosphate phosphatase